MNFSSGPGLWLKRILKWALIIEIVWLVVLNGILYLPLTQDLLNKIRPEKFYIEWESAWTPYPGRVHINGGFANGNSRSQMWQVDVGSASGYVSLPRLIFKRVAISGVEGRDIQFRMRPRIKPDKDYTQVEEYFPEIRNREVTPAVSTPLKKKRPWKISLDGARISGDHSYWIYQFQGQTAGEIQANLEYQSRGGPLELDVYKLDLDLGPHLVHGSQEMFREGRITGSMGFVPFKPRENKGVAMMDFLRLALNVDIEMDSLKFINLFVLNFKHLTVDGEGKVSGQINFDQGMVEQGTDLRVEARDLEVAVMSHLISGTGQVVLAMLPATDNLLKLGFDFKNLEVVHEDDSSPLLTGENLLLSVGGDGRIIPDPEKVNASRVIGLEIDELAVPDLALFQRYLPPKWPLTLRGGEGILDGAAELTPRSYFIDLSLKSDEAEVDIRQYRFETDLDAALKLNNPSIIDHASEVDGSYIRLQQAHLVRDGQRSEENWSAGIHLREGEFDLIGQEKKKAQEDVIDLFRILGDTEARQLLAGSGGAFSFDADVSSLAWIGAFVGEAYKTNFQGSANIEGDLNLAAGLPEPGTDIAITSHELAVDFLDYTAKGDGKIRLQVSEGGENPDWKMNLDLAEAAMRRLGEEEASIEDVTMHFEALVKDVTFQKEKPEFALSFRMPSARVTDMQTFNSHLPPDSPVRFKGGEADLTADIMLQPNDADGFVRLDSEALISLDGDQDIKADLGVDIQISGGKPADMEFEFGGSQVVLDKVVVVGSEEDYEDAEWSAVLDLTRGDAVFLEPLSMQLEARLTASDSRPIVALFRNQDGWRPEFLADALTVEDIEGDAELRMENNLILVPQAWLTSDNIEAGMKAEIGGPQGNNGRIYLKYKKLDAVLKILNGNRNLDIIRAREKYDDYEVKLPASQ